MLGSVHRSLSFLIIASHVWALSRGYSQSVPPVKFHFVTLESIMHHYIKNTDAESILATGLRLGHLDTRVS